MNDLDLMYDYALFLLSNGELPGFTILNFRRRLQSQGVSDAEIDETCSQVLRDMNSRPYPK